MTTPQIELVAVRPAVRTDAPCTLDLLVTIRPAADRPDQPRPRLNLGLVLDRSGSMSAAKKLTYAREAAGFAVRQLTATDRVSLTVFDDAVQTLHPNGPVGEPADLLRKIAAVEPGGSTALHGGWQEGGRQVQAGHMRGGLNRVLLLSDGLANVGLTEPDAIATDVHRLSKEGVGTTTLGLGDDYNEDLLEAMARSGDGNYYYVEDPAQLPAIFGAELAGLTATVGRDVTLRVEPGPGVVVADHLNDLDQTADGKLKLATLVAGLPVYVAVRVNVPASSRPLEVLRVRLAWTPPDGRRQSLDASLVLPAVSAADWAALAPVRSVQERVAVLLVARDKKAATVASAAGDLAGARRRLANAREVLAAAPAGPELDKQADALAGMEDLMARGEHVKFRKRGKYEAYSDSSSRPIR